MSTTRIAYFSMEIAVDPKIPTYSGGLGILAGDCLRSAADLALPMVAVTLVHRQGYFLQSLDAAGRQTESPLAWVPSEHAEAMPARATIQLRGRAVHIAIWRYMVKPSHAGGNTIPVYLLDTRLPENHPDDQGITDHLYGGDHQMRLLQEAVLGIGGVHALRAMGYGALDTFHMNEGHAALLAIELLAEESFARKSNPSDPAVISEVASKGVFTTHTPIAAGHDRFPLDLVFAILGEQSAIHPGAPYVEQGHLNMTRLAMHYSRFVNGVAKRHGEVSRQMLGDSRVDFITNGIHAPTWACPEVAALLDGHCPNWRKDHTSIRRALFASSESVRNARVAAKKRLIAKVNSMTNAGLDQDRFTIGFARRATGYKRADLLLHDTDRLVQIARDVGPIQLVYGGKAHPHDGQGKEIIAKIVGQLAKLGPQIKGAYLPNYDFAMAKDIVSGVDLWVNTPVPPLEASGTSGMKAALNGVPSLSTPDGWWLEGCVEGVTGWNIGRDQFGHDPISHPANRAARDASALYLALERDILPVFYRDPDMWTAICRECIALNGSQFNTQRTMREYCALAYRIRVG